MVLCVLTAKSTYTHKKKKPNSGSSQTSLQTSGKSYQWCWWWKRKWNAGIMRIKKIGWIQRNFKTHKAHVEGHPIDLYSICCYIGFVLIEMIYIFIVGPNVMIFNDLWSNSFFFSKFCVLDFHIAYCKYKFDTHFVAIVLVKRFLELYAKIIRIAFENA